MLSTFDSENFSDRVVLKLYSHTVNMSLAAREKPAVGNILRHRGGERCDFRLGALRWSGVHY